MAIELPCTHPGCTFGAEGTPYKTPALEIEYAIQVLELHDKQSHAVRGDGGSGPAGGATKIHMEKIPRPQLSGGSTQEDFRQFKIQWTSMSEHPTRLMTSGSGISSFNVQTLT